MKRRWFQIHLSTAILISTIMAFLIGLNFRSQQVGDGIEYGWPCTSFSKHPIEPIRQVILAFQTMAAKIYPSEGPKAEPPPESKYRTKAMYSIWYLPGLFVNLFTVTIICVTSAIISERYIRRPEARKP
jgi:hypothetical protein